MHIPAMTNQYFGFGGSEEWRIQGAFPWMPGNAAPVGKYVASATTLLSSDDGYQDVPGNYFSNTVEKCQYSEGICARKQSRHL